MNNTSVGAVQGSILVPEGLRAYAEQLASQFYRDQEASEFCGDQVETAIVPAEWYKDFQWLPMDALRGLGFEPDHSVGEFVMTADAAKHVDGIAGFTLFWVLHNDGLVFKQGRNKHETRVGEWFIFDDRKDHEVKSKAKTTVFLGWAVPLRELT